MPIHLLKRKTVMMRGSIEKRALEGPEHHCITRLIQRYGVSNYATARGIYRKQHDLLQNGRGTLLYGDRDRGFTFRVFHRDRYWYPVRRMHEEAGLLVTVTYLTVDMVYHNMINPRP